MTADVCRRGCCWNPFQACSRNRLCTCHAASLHQWLGIAPADEPPVRLDHPDPTGIKAVQNVMREQRKK